MLQISDVDLRERPSRTQFTDRVDACLKSLGAKSVRDQRFRKKARKTPCMNPRIGDFVELVGIDRLTDWHGLSAEEIRKDPCMEGCEADLSVLHRIINQELETHLGSCPHCLVHVSDYVAYVDSAMPTVLDMATTCLSESVDSCPLPAEQAMEEQQRLIRTTYRLMVSPDRMRARDRAEEKLYALPCSQPSLWKQIERYTLMWFCDLLMMSDYELKQRRIRWRSSYEKRMRKLHALSEHVRTCQRCAFLYEYEKNEDSYRQLVYGIL